MAKIVIDTDEPRSIKALMIAAGADRWETLIGPTSGTHFYLIPSQSGNGKRYLANEDRCDCRDHLRGNVCKHMLAVQLHLALVAFCSAEAPARR